MENFTIEQLVGAFIKCRDDKRELVKAHKEEIAELDIKLDKLQAAINVKLQEAGIDSAKTKYGTAMLTKTSKVFIDDHEAFISYIKANDDFSVLSVRPLASRVKELEEEGVDIPGIKIATERVVRIRK